MARVSDQAPSMPTTIDLVYFDAGGGHRAAATALRTVIAEQQRPWAVRCVNLFQVLDPGAKFRQLTGMNPEDYYNKRLAKGWTMGLTQELRLLQGLIRLGHHRLVARLAEHWCRTRPDMVVSLIPNFNRALLDGLNHAVPGTPFVTVLTDMADHPPNFWIEADERQHVVCGTARAAAQAREAGRSESRIHRTSGMIIRPDFYAPPPPDREAGRQSFDPARPVGIVMFGGQGSMTMLSIARELEDVQLILLCGHHRALAARLRRMKTSAAHIVVDFTPDVRRYLRMADFFVGKPGPGSLSEAVQQGLPVVTFQNRWTMPQERYNGQWVLENGVGTVASSPARVRPTVMALLERLDEFRGRVDRIENRAVFEVPDILAQILHSRVTAPESHPSVAAGLLAADPA